MTGFDIRIGDSAARGPTPPLLLPEATPTHRPIPLRAGVAHVIRWPALAVALLLLTIPATAQAFDYNLKIEPGVAFPLTSPQKDLYGVGGAVALKAGIGFWGVLDLQLAGHFVGLSNTDQVGTDPGVAWGVGGGLRLKLPHRISVVSPWVDADALYIRTGPFDRFGFTVGAGLSFALNKPRTVHLGPFVRYMQIIQPSNPGTQNDDAKILIVGLSLELGSSTGPKSAQQTSYSISDRDGDGVPDAEDRCPDTAGPASTGGCPDRDGDGVADVEDRCPDVAGPRANQGCPLDRDKDGVPDDSDKCPDVAGPKENQGCPPDTDGDGVIDSLDRCPTVAGLKELNGCPDRDKDGVADPDDYCPDVAGPADNHGCPKYKMVTVCKGKLELSEKVFFANDQSKILPKSFPLLGDVVSTLKDAKAIRVRIEGHTDGSGKIEHNQKLSEQRAKAVSDYLIKKGIAADRLESKGYGPSQPLDTNTTSEGREHNRRVDFVILNPSAAETTETIETPNSNPSNGSAK